MVSHPGQRLRLHYVKYIDSTFSRCFYFSLMTWFFIFGSIAKSLKKSQAVTPLWSDRGLLQCHGESWSDTHLTAEFFKTLFIMLFWSLPATKKKIFNDHVPWHFTKFWCKQLRRIKISHFKDFLPWSAFLSTADGNVLKSPSLLNNSAKFLYLSENHGQQKCRTPRNCRLKWTRATCYFGEAVLHIAALDKILQRDKRTSVRGLMELKKKILLRNFLSKKEQESQDPN